MAVLQTVSNGRCKICQHPERRRIETLLEHKHHHRKDVTGVKITNAYVMAKMAEWGMPNPTLENIWTHQKKHLKFVEDTKKLHALDSGRKTHVELKNGTRPHVDIDENLRWMISVGRQEIEDRLIRGEKSGITTDHILKATDALTRRQHNDAQHELLGALVGGIGHAIGAVPAKPLNEVPPAIVMELGASEVVEDAEIVEAQEPPPPVKSKIDVWAEEVKSKLAEAEAQKPKKPKKPTVSVALQLARKNPPKALLKELEQDRKKARAERNVPGAEFVKDWPKPVTA